MHRSSITFDDVLAASGVHPKVLDFALWCGLQLGSSDLTYDQQAARLQRLHPEMDKEDVLAFLGDSLTDEVADFFDRAFPVVGRSK